MIILARRKGPGDQLPSALGIKALWGFILSRSGIGRNDSLTAHEAERMANGIFGLDLGYTFSCFVSA
jgi:hypothetical protein